MKRLAMILALVATAAWAENRFRHNTLDISFVVPAGWTAIQGPAMAELSPQKDLKGERRPSLKITVQNPPPTFEQFEQLMRQSIKEKGGGRAYTLKGVGQNDVASFPARTYRYKVVEKGMPFRTDIAFVRLSKSYGYLVITECMEADAGVAEPVFAKVKAGLRLGPPRK